LFEKSPITNHPVTFFDTNRCFFNHFVRLFSHASFRFFAGMDLFGRSFWLLCLFFSAQIVCSQATNSIWSSGALRSHISFIARCIVFRCMTFRLTIFGFLQCCDGLRFMIHLRAFWRFLSFFRCKGCLQAFGFSRFLVTDAYFRFFTNRCIHVAR